MSQCLEVKVLCPAKWRRRTREAQGRHREVGSEGSVERMRGARNTNRIRGVTALGRVGTQPPSPPSTEGMFCKSSVYAQTVLRLTPGELQDALGSGVPRKLAEGGARLPDRPAAVSRGHSTYGAVGKARTVVKGSILRPVGPHARPGSRVESESWRRTPWQRMMLTLPNRRIRDPYVRWCGRGEAVRSPPIPIRANRDEHERQVGWSRTWSRTTKRIEIGKYSP